MSLFTRLRPMRPEDVPPAEALVPIDGNDGEPGKDYVLTDTDRREIAARVPVPVPEDGNDGEPGKDAKITDEIKADIAALIPRPLDGKDAKITATLKAEIAAQVKVPPTKVVRGPVGPPPEHEIGTGKHRYEIRFKHPNGRWGRWINLKLIQHITQGGGGGGGGGGGAGGDSETDNTLNGVGSAADPLTALGIHKASVVAGDTVTIDAGFQMLNCGNFTVDGDLIVDGDFCEVA